MTVSITSAAILCKGNGSTTAFSYNFPIPDSSSIRVTYTDANGVSTVLTYGTQYSATGLGSATGGTVTYPLAGSAIAAGTSVYIQRVVPYTQPTSFPGQSNYSPTVTETCVDRLEMQIQQIAQQAARTVLFGTGTDMTATDNFLPSPTLGQFLGWGTGTDGNTALLNMGTVTSGVAATAFMQTVLAAASQASAQTVLGVSSTATVASNGLDWLTSVSGADTILGTPLFQPVAHAAGQVWRFLVASTNTTTAPTLKVGTLSALTIQRLGGGTVFPGDLTAGQLVEVVNTDGSHFQMLPPPSGIRLGASVSASGVPIDFTNVPAWANRATFFFSGVSLSGTDNFRFQLGTGGSPTTTGYVGAELRVTSAPASAWQATSGSGFDAMDGGATRNATGFIQFTRMTGNTWIGFWVLFNDAPFVAVGVGSIALAGVMNIVRFTTSTGNTYDAGTIGYIYE